MMADVEAEVVAAGASPTSVEVRLEEVPERSTVRAVATGSVGLAAGALPGRKAVTLADIVAARGAADTADAVGSYFVWGNGSTVTVLDRFGDELVVVDGERAAADQVDDAVERHTRYRGPVTLRPTVWIIDGSRLIELAASPTAGQAYDGRTDVTYVIGRQR
jgi:membrane-bound inhibitor of C-type lysozyme